MVDGDGDGWVECGCGHRHWGRHGAAGLVLLRSAPRPPEVLLQLRAGWTHEGGCWGIVGGARDSQESVAQTALREAGEEAGIDSSQVTLLGVQVGVNDIDWSYTYVLARAASRLRVGPTTSESDELRWVDLDQVAALPLHAGLAATWPALRRRIDELLSADADADAEKITTSDPETDTELPGPGPS
jgi:8-oxo-dGTP diphosphatase